MNGDVKYQENAEALRHYSTCILHVRTLTVVQGTLILGGFLYSQTLKATSLPWLIAFFGALLTGALWFQQWNYLGDFAVHLEGFKGAAAERPSKHETWAMCVQRHEATRSAPLFGVLIESGPFVLFGVVFVLLGLASLFDFWPGLTGGTS